MECPIYANTISERRINYNVTQNLRNFSTDWGDVSETDDVIEMTRSPIKIEKLILRILGPSRDALSEKNEEIKDTTSRGQYLSQHLSLSHPHI